MHHLAPACVVDPKTSGRQRAISEPGFVADSTSDDTKSSGAGEEETSQSNPQGEDESSQDDERFIAEMCRPITSLVPSCQAEGTRKFLFDACAGLSGAETLHQYACVYQAESRRFFVWLGDLDFSLFTKSTFMNLSNFAEELGAQTITFLVYHQHRQKAQYRSMFKVIDAMRLGTDAVKDLVGSQDRQAAKSILATTLFYELVL